MVMAMLVHPEAAETSAGRSRVVAAMEMRYTRKASHSVVPPDEAGRTAEVPAVAQVTDSRPQRALGAGGAL